MSRIAACPTTAKKISAVVAQLSRRKPALKKTLAGSIPDDALPHSACPAPVWQPGPVRVSFAPASDTKQTLAIRGPAVDLSDAEDDEEASK
jgi:hypothetical protein